MADMQMIRLYMLSSIEEIKLLGPRKELVDLSTDNDDDEEKESNEEKNLAAEPRSRKEDYAMERILYTLKEDENFKLLAPAEQSKQIIRQTLAELPEAEASVYSDTVQSLLDAPIVDAFNLQRFINAQNKNDTYKQALKELQQGKKVTHWMWYIFPTMLVESGVVQSDAARKYAITCIEEAQAYMDHAILGPRLIAAMLHDCYGQPKKGF